jgi:pimeloyl-ACP methyl ester carboxylesterase
VLHKLAGLLKPHLGRNVPVATRLDLVLRRLKLVFTVASNRAMDAVPPQQIGRFPNGRRKKANGMKPTDRNVTTKLYAVAALAATLIGGTLLLERTVKVAEAAPPTGVKNVVLVHGAFADGSGWGAVAKILEKDGYTVSIAQPPETSYAEDVKYAKAAIDAMGGPVVLVGHSYGGSIITEAGNDPTVSALVYIAAFALNEGESCASIEQALPQASKAFKPDSNGNWWIEQEHFAADFAADIPPAESHYMAISQVPISTDSFTHKVTSPAWKTKPTWYMVATADRSINPDQERMMAKRANAKTVEVNASHVAYMSHPKETAKLIEEAAASAPVNH